MKNLFKKTISIIMATAVMSTLAIGTCATAFAAENTQYNITFHTAGSDGISINDIHIIIHGTNGSTKAHNLGVIGIVDCETASFSDVNVGEITGITVNNDDRISLTSASDGWYPEYIDINGTRIYGGRWVDDEKPVKMTINDNIYKLTVNTGSDYGSGTDSDVKVKFYSTTRTNGVYKKYVEVSDTINLSSIHPDTNAFERYDSSTFYIYVSSKFSDVKRVEFQVPDKFTAGVSWKLSSFEGSKIQGDNTGEHFSASPNTWIAGSEDWQKSFSV